MRAFTALLALLFTLIVGAPKVYADTPANAEKMTVGLFVNQIYAIDIKNNSFGVDFWIWFRWSGQGPSPLDSFELMGGRITSRSNVVKKKLSEGVEYNAVRVNATVHKQWDLKQFPFDDHTLRIQVEDAEREVSRGVYVADAENEGIDPEVTVSGWDVVGHRHEVVDHAYHSNYGDTSAATNAETHYSRYIFDIELKRNGWGRFFKFFFGLFIATFVSWCAFFVRPKDASPRVSVSVGAMFAAAAVTIGINNQMPDTGYVTLADKLVYLSLAMILVSLFGTIIALTLHYGGKEEMHRRVDKTAAAVFPLVYIVAVLIAVR